MDGFLEFNGSKLRIRAGKAVQEQAKLHAETDFENYKIMKDRLYKDDFDRFLTGLEIELE